MRVSPCPLPAQAYLSCCWLKNDVQIIFLSHLWSHMKACSKWTIGCSTLLAFQSCAFVFSVDKNLGAIHRIVGNTNCAIWEPPAKIFCTKFYACNTHLYDWFSIPRESFLHEMLSSYQSTKVFSLTLYSRAWPVSIIGLKRKCNWISFPSNIIIFNTYE
jgi:hypothetical protein